MCKENDCEGYHLKSSLLLMVVMVSQVLEAGGIQTLLNV
jgi:hypothetical protein